MLFRSLLYTGFFPGDPQLRGLEAMQYLVDPFNPLFYPSLLCLVQVGQAWAEVVVGGDGFFVDLADRAEQFTMTMTFTARLIAWSRPPVRGGRRFG